MPPHSALFEVRQTPHAGRAVFASQPIPSGTLLHTATDVPVATIYRPYIKETCAQCFAYDHGRNWPMREGGLAWCSQMCREGWIGVNGLDGLQAFCAVERTIAQQKLKERERNLGEPTQQEADTAWTAAQKMGDLVLAARQAEKPSKAQNRILSKLDAVEPDVLTYLLAGVLGRRSAEWDDMLELHPSDAPYRTRNMLRDHISGYHLLLSVLPPTLLPFTSPDVLRSVVSRDAHNSFGIRSLDDGGSEMFGHGIWPSASYWNHSCAPNVAKRRVGRTWEFRAMRDVPKDAELCITYLGGEERDLNKEERRTQLYDAWRFWCACARCQQEEPKTCLE